MTGWLRRCDPRQITLWPLTRTLAASLVVAAIVLAATTWVALALLGFPNVQHPRSISLTDLIALLQLEFASIAGAGLVVGWVMGYRRERAAAAEAERGRVQALSGRFAPITAQLGSDQPAIRLAGVHALAGLADDWKENRQTCIDVLCAILRMPYDPDPGEEASAAQRLNFQANREVRQTVIRVIAARLGPDAAVSWRGMDFDFTGADFDGGDFSGAEFSGGRVSFRGCKFSSGRVSFQGAILSGGLVDFTAAAFSGGVVSFPYANFSGGVVSFHGVDFSDGLVDFTAAAFSGGEVCFRASKFRRVNRWIS